MSYLIYIASIRRSSLPTVHNLMMPVTIRFPARAVQLSLCGAYKLPLFRDATVFPTLQDITYKYKNDTQV